MAESAQQLALMRRALSSVDPRTSDITGDPSAAQAIVDYPGQLIREGQDNNRQYLADVMAASKNPFDPSNDDAKQRIADRSLAVAASVGKPLNMAEPNRMFRAQKMGFDPETTYYHGTGGSINKDADSIEEFSKDLSATPGVAGFFTKDPKLASEFSELKTSSGNQVLPVHLKAQNTFDYANPSHVRAILNNRSIGDAAARAGYEINGKPMGSKELAQQIEMGNWNFLELPEVVDAIKGAGFDSMHVLEKGQKNIAVFEPNQIRSTFAAFDPKKADSGNISAGIGVGGALGSAALADRLKPKEQSY